MLVVKSSLAVLGHHRYRNVVFIYCNFACCNVYFSIAIIIYCNNTVLKILNLLGFFTLTSVLSSSLNLVLTAVIVAF